MNVYISSVGNNACLNLNIPPDNRGKFDERDVARLKEFGDMLKNSFSNELQTEITQQESTPLLQPVYNVKLNGKQKVSLVVLEEDIAQGQRVEQFKIKCNGHTEYHGTCIGHKKICRIEDDIEADEIEIHVTISRGEVLMKSIKVY